MAITTWATDEGSAFCCDGALGVELMKSAGDETSAAEIALTGSAYVAVCIAYVAPELRKPHVEKETKSTKEHQIL